MAEKLQEDLQRIHVLVFRRDWQWLHEVYPDGMKRGAILRQLLRDHRVRIEELREERERRERDREDREETL
jgi:hypothetical protein